jgi:hypothetical protein
VQSRRSSPTFQVKTKVVFLLCLKDYDVSHINNSYQTFHINVTRYITTKKERALKVSEEALRQIFGDSRV